MAYIKKSSFHQDKMKEYKKIAQQESQATNYATRASRSQTIEKMRINIKKKTITNSFFKRK